MASFNKVILLGHMTRDPEFKYLPSQTPVCDFGLAMNHTYTRQDGEKVEDVCFIDCTAFGKLAEIINQYCTKGKQILVEGRLKYDSWEDRNGGGKRSKVSVVCETMKMLGAPTGTGGGNQYEQRPAASPAAARGRENYQQSRQQTQQQHRPPASRQQRGGDRNAPPPPPPQQPFGNQFDPDQEFKEDDIPF